MTESKEIFDRLMDRMKTYTEGKSFNEIYEDGLNRANNLGKTAKLLWEVSSDGTELDRVFIEIGKLYYEEHRDDPSDFYKPLFERVEEITGEIESKRAKLAEYKSAALGNSSPVNNESDEGCSEVIDFAQIKADKTSESPEK